MKNIRRVNLAQLSSRDDSVFGSSAEEAPKDGEQSIADMTSSAKEQIKTSIANGQNNAENNEKKEEPKKEQEKKESTDGDDGSSDEDKKEAKKEDGPKEHALAAQDQNQTSKAANKEQTTT